MSTYRYIEVCQRGDVTEVHVVNPLIQDRLLINELGDELIEFIEREKPKKLLVNFDRVTYCSSEVIGGLIRARTRVLGVGGNVRLCGMRPEVRKLFQITHLDGTIFHIDDTVEQSVEALAQS